jgi:hypothetical protein
MEEQVLKIMDDLKVVLTGEYPFNVEIDSKEKSAKEITSMVFEFMEWAVRKEMLQYSGSAEEWQTTYCGNYLNIEELFQYWWDNVKNK